ncbi:MAG: Flp pilus assembly protein CpaB [Hyphomonadaceae bacterium]|nr:Flp pilus assembly protein CpaB [Hyphomonadaceae bacterium]
MSARQLIVLVVAAIAAVGALLLIRGLGSRQAEQTSAESEQIAGQQVLVAARDIPQGAALAPSDLAVALFPTSSVSGSFIRLDQQPSAQADFVGGVTRRPFVQGEPIVAASVVQPDGRGFLAAQLQPGFRAVAVEIEKTTAVGGFIQPNDHVDVIVTARLNNREGGGEQVNSDIILRDIRVLALGETTTTQDSGNAPAIVEAGVAVLEMSAEDARILALGDEMGTISLALRGVQAETVGMNTPSNGRQMSQSSGSVRVHAYGAVSGGN